MRYTFVRQVNAIRHTRERQQTIHLIAKWRPINHSFVCMLISPLRLVNMYKKQKRANQHANKTTIYWPPFWNKVHTQ